MYLCKNYLLGSVVHSSLSSGRKRGSSHVPRILMTLLVIAVLFSGFTITVSAYAVTAQIRDTTFIYDGLSHPTRDEGLGSWTNFPGSENPLIIFTPELDLDYLPDGSWYYDTWDHDSFSWRVEGRPIDPGIYNLNIHSLSIIRTTITSGPDGVPIETKSDVTALYDITYLPGKLIILGENTLTISFSAKDKKYDGTTTAEPDGNFVYTGLQAGDDVSIQGGKLNFDTPDVGENKVVTLSDYTIVGADKDKYTITVQDTTMADITGPELTVSFTANDKVYDGTRDAGKADEFVYTGLLEGDEVLLEGGEFLFDTKDVGEEKPVTLTGYTVSGRDAGNYLVVVEAGAASITKKDLTISYQAKDKKYDQTTAAQISGDFIYLGRVSGDDVHVTDAVFTFEDAEIGIGKTVTMSGYTVGGTDADNYEIEVQETAFASITEEEPVPTETTPVPTETTPVPTEPTPDPIQTREPDNGGSDDGLDLLESIGVVPVPEAEILPTSVEPELFPQTPSSTPGTQTVLPTDTDQVSEPSEVPAEQHPGTSTLSGNPLPSGTPPGEVQNTGFLEKLGDFFEITAEVVQYGVMDELFAQPVLDGLTLIGLDEHPVVEKAAKIFGINDWYIDHRIDTAGKSWGEKAGSVIAEKSLDLIVGKFGKVVGVYATDYLNWNPTGIVKVAEFTIDHVVKYISSLSEVSEQKAENS